MVQPAGPLRGVAAQPPQGQWIGPIEPRQFIENRRLADGSFLSIYNELYHPANGANYIGIYLSPNMQADPVVGVTAGTWIVRLHGREIRDGRYRRLDRTRRPARRRPARSASRRGRSRRSSPSGSMVDDSTVSSLGCGHRVLTVANLDAARNLINISSSQGPTRDGRYKPDVAAPGTDIVAAKASPPTASRGSA